MRREEKAGITHNDLVVHEVGAAVAVAVKEPRQDSCDDGRRRENN